jgi:C4-dicarboxylate-specific signal transduction histidine kinase
MSNADEQVTGPNRSSTNFYGIAAPTLQDASHETAASLLDLITHSFPCRGAILTLAAFDKTWLKMADEFKEIETDAEFISELAQSSEILTQIDVAASRLRGCAWAKGSIGIRHVTATPLQSYSSQQIGWLLLIDEKNPNGLSPDQKKTLQLQAKVAASSLLSHISIRDASQQMRNMLEHQTSGLLATNREGLVTFANSLLFSTLGLKNDLTALIPTSGLEVLSSEHSRIADTQNFHAFLQNAFESRVGVIKDEFATVDDGVIEVEFFPIEIKSHFDGHLITVRDLSELRRSEDLVELQRLQIIESQKLSALGEMASGIAHEINNPMAIIYGRAMHLVEMSKQGSVSIPQVASHSQHIVNVSERVMKIISGLRSFSRNGEKDALRLESVNDIIEGTLTFCSQRLKSLDIELHILLGTEPVKILCRPVQVSQILLNLINNSIDAISKFPQKWIKIEAIPVFQEVLLIVEDSGLGIAPELQDKIFNPFFSTKLEQKGTGLGLSISQNMARSQGGDLQLDPTSRHTRFVLRMPASKHA